jgi:hypothetical protein
MNDFSDIESELRSLRPVQPSDRLFEGVARQLEKSSAGAAPAEGKIIRPHWFRFGGFSLGAALAAAAAIFILARLDTFTVQRHGPRTAKATPVPAAAAVGSAQFIPDGATRVVYRTHDEGLIFPQGADEPVRRVRSRTKETLQWRNPKTGASLSVTYPSEEVRFIPVSGQ